MRIKVQRAPPAGLNRLLQLKCWLSFNSNQQINLHQQRQFESNSISLILSFMAKCQSEGQPFSFHVITTICCWYLSICRPRCAGIFIQCAGFLNYLQIVSFVCFLLLEVLKPVVTFAYTKILKRCNTFFFTHLWRRWLFPCDHKRRKQLF